MTDWTRHTLGELISVKHGYAFKGEFFAETGDELVLTPGNFKVGGGLQVRPGKERYYTGDYPHAFRLRAGALLVVMTDLKQDAPILGSPAVVPERGTYLHNQRLGLVTIKRPELLEERFLYWLLLHDGSRAQLRATATGATVRHTAPERIYRVEAHLPEPDEQRRIAAVLDAIENAAENARRRIVVLDRLASLIYREWFVHLRYPGGEPGVDAPPADWERVQLSAVASVVMGQAPPSGHYNPTGEGLPFHQGVRDFGSHYPHRRLYCTYDGRQAGPGDILLSVRAPVGRLNRADAQIVIGRGLAAIRSREDQQALLAQHLRHVFRQEDSMGGGTIFNAITKSDLTSVEILQPSPALRDKAEAVFRPIDALIYDLTFTERHTTRLRNVLLPRLITGAVQAPQLEGADLPAPSAA